MKQENTVRPFAGVRDSAARFAERFPCALAALSAGCVILPALLFPDAVSPGMVFPAVIPLLLLAAWLFPLRDACWKFALPALLSGISLILYSARIHDSTLADQVGILPCGAQAEFRIEDSSTSGETLPWMPPPNHLRARVLRFRLTDSDSWREVSASGAGIVLRVPASLGESFRIGYHDVVRCHGFFAPVPEGAFPGAFDYRAYLARRGIHLEFQIQSVETLESGSGALRLILNGRDLFLKRFCAGIPSDSVKQVCAGILFGFRQGVSGGTKRDFIESGTIHILTVSGTHVGIVAGLLLLLLRPVPYRLRWMSLPLPVLLYAFSTGMQAPSFRAFVMLSVFAVSKAFLCSLSVMNTLFFAGFLLMLWNPGNLADAGFQYSFLTVFALLLSGRAIREWLSPLTEKWHWVPSDSLTRRSIWSMRLLRAFLGTLLGCVLAWLISGALALLYQGVFTGGAVLANLFLIPIAFLCFALSGVSVLFLPFPVILSGLSATVGVLLEIMTDLAVFFAENGCFHLPFAPVWSVFLFSLLVIALLRFRRKRLLLACLALMLALIFFWNLRGKQMPDELLVLEGNDAAIPVLALMSPRNGDAVIVNVPDFESARLLSTRLDQLGITRIRTLLLTGNRKAYAGGALFLSRKCNVEELLLPQRVASNPEPLLELIRELRGQGASIRIAEGTLSGGRRISACGLKTVFSRDILELEFLRTEPRLTARLEMVRDGEGTTLIFLPEESGASPRRLVLRNRTPLQVHRIEWNGTMESK